MMGRMGRADYTCDVPPFSPIQQREAGICRAKAISSEILRQSQDFLWKAAAGLDPCGSGTVQDQRDLAATRLSKITER